MVAVINGNNSAAATPGSTSILGGSTKAPEAKQKKRPAVVAVVKAVAGTKEPEEKKAKPKPRQLVSYK